MEHRINKRIAKTILHALAGGTVPDNGLQYIAVGRKDEVAAIVHDMEQVAEGYSTFRLLEGAYGTGKSFMAKLIKNEALLRGFVVMNWRRSGSCAARSGRDWRPIGACCRA